LFSREKIKGKRVEKVITPYQGKITLVDLLVCQMDSMAITKVISIKLDRITQKLKGDIDV